MSPFYFILFFYTTDLFLKKTKPVSVDLKNIPHYRCVSLHLLSLLFPVNWK